MSCHRSWLAAALVASHRPLYPVLDTAQREAWNGLAAEVELTRVPVEHVAGIDVGTPGGTTFLAARCG